MLMCEAWGFKLGASNGVLGKIPGKVPGKSCDHVRFPGRFPKRSPERFREKVRQTCPVKSDIWSNFAMFDKFLIFVDARGTLIYGFKYTEIL